MTRPGWDETFMGVAAVVAQRATCPRASIGAVIVDTATQHILSTGYNGAPPGQPHCTEAGCAPVNGHCSRAIHAERNAILQAARRGTRLEGATIYIHGPRRICEQCAQMLDSLGIKRRIESMAGDRHVAD